MPLTNRSNVPKRPGSSRLLFGAIIILLGVVLLLDTTDTYPIDGLSVFLAGLFALYGLYGLFRWRFRKVFWPGVFVLVGGLWLAVEFEVLTESVAWDFWPLVLVLFGVSVLTKRRRGTLVATPYSGYVSEDARDGDVVAVFGSARSDLRGAANPERLDAVAIFGTVEVIVPEDWNVSVQTARIFGDVRDERRDQERDGTADLVLGGAAIFGDVVLRE